MTQEEMKDLAADRAWTYQQGISYFNQPTTREAYYDGFVEGHKAGVESAQPEWRYVERDGLPQSNRLMIVAFTNRRSPGKVYLAMAEYDSEDGSWDDDNGKFWDSNFAPIHAYMDLPTRPPLPPAKNQ